MIFDIIKGMNTVVKPLAEKKIKKGIQLIEMSDLKDSDIELDSKIVDLINYRGEFLAKAYFSPQHKGVGWVFSQGYENLDFTFFINKFQEARRKRYSFFESDLTTAYRLFNQDGDGFGGLTIDRYGDFAVFSWYNSFVYDRKELIITAFREIFPEIVGGYEKIRFNGLDYVSSHLFGQLAPKSITIKENGVCYRVFMNDGLMTGIFLDQHEVRGCFVDGLATGKSLLNMFSYTAAFSIAAAMGGASQTCSVDLAKRSKELSEAHFIANGMDCANHTFMVMDVFAYFKYAKKKGLSYDIIVLDPPSFARNKKQTFSVAKDYHKLIAQSLDILNPKGIIIASTNAANVTIERFKQEIEKGFGTCPHRYVQVHRLPADFVYNKNDESSNYLKVFTIEVQR